jgi:predicted nucleic acid-binding Zn ribbon protein
MAEAKIICRKCREAIPIDSNFCARCGTPRFVEPEVKRPSDPNPPNHVWSGSKWITKEDQKVRSRNMIIMYVVTMLIFVGFAVYIFTWHQ